MDTNTAMALIIAHFMRGDTFDYAAICSKLAAADPVMFMRLAGIGPNSAWIQDVRDHLQKGDLLPAIKILRQVHGIGLWEAKQIVDVYRNSHYDQQSSTKQMRGILQQLRGY